MSLHKKPLTTIEETGLRAHGLDIGTPSQLSDCFRHGVAWALEQAAKRCEARAQHRFDEHGTCEHDTNAQYYQGGRGDEYETRDEEDQECADEIRNMK